MKLPLGHVTVWQMTEEERLAYIEKHPIRPTKKEQPTGWERDQRGIDYKWRGNKGAASRWKEQ